MLVVVAVAVTWRRYGHMPRVRTPGIKWDYTSRRVLTMEWIEGVKLTNKKVCVGVGLVGCAVLHARPAAALALAAAQTSFDLPQAEGPCSSSQQRRGAALSSAEP